MPIPEGTYPPTRSARHPGQMLDMMYASPYVGDTTFPEENTMDTLLLMVGLLRDLASVWATPVLMVATIATVGFFGAKMVRTARRNAQVRAARRARDAYRAPVIDITHRLAERSNIA